MQLKRWHNYRNSLINQSGDVKHCFCDKCLRKQIRNQVTQAMIVIRDFLQFALQSADGEILFLNVGAFAFKADVLFEVQYFRVNSARYVNEKENTSTTLDETGKLVLIKLSTHRYCI